MKTMALRCKTLAEIMALYRNNPGTLNISKPSTLWIRPCWWNFDRKRENSADGHTQNTNHQYVMKWRVGQNGTINSLTNNTLIVHEEVGDEIRQLKWVSFKPTIVVDNTDYFNKIHKDDETQKALCLHGILKKKKHFLLSTLKELLS